MNAASVVRTITGHGDIQTLLVVKKISNFMHSQVVGMHKIWVLSLMSTAGTSTRVKYEPPCETLTTAYLPLIVLKSSSLNS